MIELHIFTNATKSAPDTSIIERTYESFLATFGKIPVTVWVDPNPNIARFTQYRSNLKKIFPVVNEMASLSDGYLKAIRGSEADYIFCLEHDWLFLSDRIHHTLDDIIKVMEFDCIYHLRFNKRDNVNQGWERNTKFEQVCIESPLFKQDFYYLKTNILSNNPHIINRQFYLDHFMSRIKVMPGSKGIECQLSTGDLWGAIYGPLGYPATLHHEDGRRSC